MKITKTLKFSLFAALTLTMAGCGSDDGVHIDDGGNEGGGEVVGGDNAFSFKVSNITGINAFVEVTPTDKTATYYYDVIEKATLDGYTDKTAFMNDYIAELKELVDEFAALGITFEDMLSVGDESYDYTAYFEPSTDYYVFAAGVASDGTVTTDVSTFPFSTTAPQKSNNKFTISVNGGEVTVVPSVESDNYIWDMQASSDIAGMNDNEIIADEIAYLTEEGMLSDAIIQGTDSYDFGTDLTSGTKYTVYAFGYDGAASTALTKYEFTYTGSGSGSGGEGGGETGAGQGVYTETFAGYTGGAQSPYLASDSFTSTATGVTWTVEYGVISQDNDNASFDYANCLTMGGKSGKADDGQSTITSSVLADGITKLSFAYIANAGKKLEVQVLSGGSVVWTSGELTLENNAGSTPKALSFDIAGASSNAVIKFINISSARRISIGNISWTNATGEGGNGSGSGSGGGEGGGDISEDEDTTLTGDVTMSGATWAQAEYYGDYYETGTNNWMLFFGNDSAQISLEFFTELTATAPNGVYKMAATGEAGTLLPGDMDEEGYLYGTYYGTSSDGEYLDGWALAVSGTANITLMGTSYNILANFSDSKGHTIVGTYSGELTISKGEVETASMSSKNIRSALGTLHRFSSTLAINRVAKAKAASGSARKAAVSNSGSFSPRKTMLRSNGLAGKILVKRSGK